MANPSFGVDSGIRLAQQASVPTAGTAANPVLWADNSAPPKLHFDDGTTSNILAYAGGGSTLHGSYAAGASQTDSTINLDSTRLGVLIKDNATPIGATLFSVQSSGGQIFFDSRAAYTAIGTDLLPVADNTYNLGNLSSPLRWATVNALAFKSGASQMQFTSALVSGTAPEFAFVTTAATSGAVGYLSLTGSAATGQTASTEVNGVLLDLSATRTWATGALTTQREFYVKAPTYAFAAASTITTAATLVISGAPIAGANATITNGYALNIEGGAVGLPAAGVIKNNAQGATNTTGITVAPNVADGATSIGMIVNVATTFANAGARLFKIQNNGTDELTVDKVGNIYLPNASSGVIVPNGAAAGVYNAANSKGIFADFSSDLAGGVFGGPFGPYVGKSYTLGTPTREWSYLYTAGTAGVNGDFALSAGWGTTASVSVTRGDDTHIRFVVTSSGTGQAANPTITWTFHDGTKTNIPFCVSKLQATTDSTINTVTVTDAPTATTDVITYNGTPVATKTYTIDTIAIGS